MFITMPLDCKKTILNIRIHHILDKIGFLLYDINTSKKLGAAAPQAPGMLLYLFQLLTASDSKSRKIQNIRAHSITLFLSMVQKCVYCQSF